MNKSLGRVCKFYSRVIHLPGAASNLKLSRNMAILSLYTIYFCPYHIWVTGFGLCNCPIRSRQFIAVDSDWLIGDSPTGDIAKTMGIHCIVFIGFLVNRVASDWFVRICRSSERHHDKFESLARECSQSVDLEFVAYYSRCSSSKTQTGSLDDEFCSAFWKYISRASEHS